DGRPAPAHRPARGPVIIRRVAGATPQPAGQREGGEACCLAQEPGREPRIRAVTAFTPEMLLSLRGSIQVRTATSSHVTAIGTTCVKTSSWTTFRECSTRSTASGATATMTLPSPRALRFHLADVGRS